MTNRRGFYKDVVTKKKERQNKYPTWLVDIYLAITNGYIVHRANCKKKEIKAMTHVQYMCNLHLQLIALTGTSWEDVRVEEAEEETVQDTEPGAHSPKQNDDRRDHSGQRKEVQRNCKVCAMRAKVVLSTAISEDIKGKFRVRTVKSTSSPGKSPARHRRVGTE
ncbi:hypothetical protein PC123_g6789 [Phytophthora cactorum]|nr:hypothetical protein PC123_g6789 [Phytophthora cactorum]